MEGKVPNNIKKERADRLSTLKHVMMKETREKYLGEILEVLVEEEKNGEYLGYTDNYLRVRFKSEKKELLNSLVKIKIIEIEDEILIGKEDNTNNE